MLDNITEANSGIGIGIKDGWVNSNICVSIVAHQIY